MSDHNKTFQQRRFNETILTAKIQEYNEEG